MTQLCALSLHCLNSCMYMFSGVYWGASPEFSADHSHPAAAAGPSRCPGSQTVAVWRLSRRCRAAQHYCGPGTHSWVLLLKIQQDLIWIFVPIWIIWYLYTVYLKGIKAYFECQHGTFSVSVNVSVNQSVSACEAWLLLWNL